jgi:hypothetical protein
MQKKWETIQNHWCISNRGKRARDRVDKLVPVRSKLPFKIKPILKKFKYFLKNIGNREALRIFKKKEVMIRLHMEVLFWTRILARSPLRGCERIQAIND